MIHQWSSGSSSPSTEFLDQLRHRRVGFRGLVRLPSLMRSDVVVDQLRFWLRCRLPAIFRRIPEVVHRGQTLAVRHRPPLSDDIPSLFQRVELTHYRTVDPAPAVQLPEPRSAPHGPWQPARHPSPPGSTRLQPGFACRLGKPAAAIRSRQRLAGPFRPLSLGASPQADRHPSPMLPPQFGARPPGSGVRVTVRRAAQVLGRCRSALAGGSLPGAAAQSASTRRPPARRRATNPPLQPPRPGPRVPAPLYPPPL